MEAAAEQDRTDPAARGSNGTPQPAATTLEQALGQEVLASERLRLTIVAGLAGLLLTVLVVVRLLPPELAARAPNALKTPFQLWLALGAFVYALAGRAIVGHRVRRGGAPLTIVRYLNAFVEMSLPTLGMVLLASSVESAYALFTPGSMISFLFLTLAVLRLDFWLCAFSGAVAAVEYLAVALPILADPLAQAVDPQLTAPGQHIARAVMYLLAGLLAGLASVQLKRQIVRSFETLEERNRIVDMFGQHVSPAVVDKLLGQDLELGGEVRHVCLMFLDIRGFTAFSSGRRPEEVVEYLNRLFDFMVEAVNRHNGIVNKFLGDGFMAVFGAPLSDGRDSQNAVAAAREIVARVSEANASGEIPSTRIGIGLHAGEAVTGNVGSSRRKEYTIIGDAVNLASRIEQLTKEHGAQILVSGAVYRALDDDARDAMPLGSVQVRGLEEPVEVYRLA